MNVRPDSRYQKPSGREAISQLTPNARVKIDASLLCADRLMAPYESACPASRLHLYLQLPELSCFRFSLGFSRFPEEQGL